MLTIESEELIKNQKEKPEMYEDEGELLSCYNKTWGVFKEIIVEN